MSSKLQLDVCRHNQWWCRLANACECKIQVWCCLQVKLWSIPECLESAVLAIKRYINICLPSRLLWLWWFLSTCLFCCADQDLIWRRCPLSCCSLQRLTALCYVRRTPILIRPPPRALGRRLRVEAESGRRRRRQQPRITLGLSPYLPGRESRPQATQRWLPPQLNDSRPTNTNRAASPDLHDR